MVYAEIGPILDEDDVASEDMLTTDEVAKAAEALQGDSATFKIRSSPCDEGEEEGDEGEEEGECPLDITVTWKGKVVFAPPSPSPPCLDADGCFDYGGDQCHAAFSKCSMWDADTGTHGPKEVSEVMKFGAYTCCDAGYICAPGGLKAGEGFFGGKTCTAEECKYWSCKPRADGLASIKAYEALFDDAETEEDDDEEPPCVDNLDAKKNGKYKKKFCDKKKAQGKCDSKPRFMKKVCSKTCGFCEAAEGEEDEDEEEETKEVVAPPACENTPGKKKRKRGLQVWCDNKSTRNQGKVSACPATAPSSPPPLLRPPASSRGGSHAPPPLAHPALAGVQEEEDPQRMLRDVRGEVRQVVRQRRGASRLRDLR